MKTIVIDSGHGGHVNAGRSSPNSVIGRCGTLEKTLTLDVARRMRAALPDHRVVLTRDRDVNVTLGGRAQVAQRERADVFLALHFNGDRDPDVQGIETFVHYGASDASRSFAGRVQRTLSSATGHRARGVAGEEVAVLSPSHHAPHTAACLTEISYLSDPREEQRLRDPAYRDRIAGALATAVREQLGETPRRNGPRHARVLEEVVAPSILSFTTDVDRADPGASVTVRWSVLGNFSSIQVWPSMQEQPLTTEGTAVITIDPENITLDGTSLVILIVTPTDGSEPVFQPLAIPVSTGAPAGSGELYAQLGALPPAIAGEDAQTAMVASLELPWAAAIRPWADLISFRPPTTIQSAIAARDATWFFHRLDNFNYGGDINLDYYPVQVTTLPDKPGGGKYTAEEWLEYCRMHFNDIIDTSYARFSPYSTRYATGIQDNHWITREPLGAVVSIDIPADDGSVCCTRSRDDQWIFSTLHTTGDGDHPVTGNRQWGLIKQDDGSVVYFTRGADRATGLANNLPIVNSVVFLNGDRLWQSFQRGMKAMVEARGGVASIKPRYSNRVWWILARDYAHNPSVPWI